MPIEHLRLVAGQRNELEVETAGVRRFQCINEAEPVELSVFTDGPIYVAHATDEGQHVRLLREAERIRGYRGAYQLVNGPMNPDLLYRYEPNTWNNAKPGRATDRDIQQLRALFIDIDPERPKNISSTDAQLREAWEVSDRLESWLASELGDSFPLGHGCSGNGYFTLIAIEPEPPTADTVKRISVFLKMLNDKFRTPNVKIDTSVANAARLMPAPGTWKRKGRDAAERPHRMTSFSCRSRVRRVPLKELV